MNHLASLPLALLTVTLGGCSFSAEVDRAAVRLLDAKAAPAKTFGAIPGAGGPSAVDRTRTAKSPEIRNGLGSPNDFVQH